MEKGLDEILNDSAEVESIVEPKSEFHEEAPLLDRPRDEHGRFAAKETGDLPSGDEPQAAASPAASQESHIPETALLGERRRRQEADRRIEMLEQQLQQFTRSQPQVEQEAPDFWENPNAVIGNQVAQAVSTAFQQWQQAQTARELQASARAAQAKYPDFNDMFEEFTRLEQVNPQLTQQALASGDAAEFAYKTAKSAKQVAQYGDIPSLLAAERAKWEAELKAASPISPTLPTTTAGQRSVGDRSGPEWAGPQSLSAILS